MFRARSPETLKGKTFEQNSRKSGAKRQIVGNSALIGRHFGTPSWPRNIGDFEHWELLFRRPGNEMTNEDKERAFSWPGYVFIKMADEEGFFDLSLLQANFKQCYGFYFFKSKNKAH